MSYRRLCREVQWPLGWSKKRGENFGGVTNAHTAEGKENRVTAALYAGITTSFMKINNVMVNINDEA